jgi:nicotinamide-nucleotide amidase
MSAESALERLESEGLTAAVAESLTGGLLAAEFVAVPGASRVFRGGVVVYATDLKASLLDVDSTLLDERGPVDPDVAIAMAIGVRRLLGASVGLATTGVAGPDPQDGKAPGTVFVAVSIAGRDAVVRELAIAGGRDDVRKETVTAAMGMLVSALG